MSDAVNLALLVGRVWVGVVMAAHGLRHVRALRSGPGMANWLSSLGLSNGPLQARRAAGLQCQPGVRTSGQAGCAPS